MGSATRLMLGGLGPQRFLRVVVAARPVALAFVAGVAGDLTEASTPRTHGTRVMLTIPPDTPRAPHCRLCPKPPPRQRRAIRN